MNTRALDSPRVPRAAMRPRLPILMGGLLALWVTAWYSRGGSLGLVTLTGVCALVALTLPRSLPGSVRAVIWSGVLLSVVCLAANLERIAPVAGQVDLLHTYQYDRIVTVALAFALAALFFRPARVTVTVLGAGCLPMIMLALLRDRDRTGGDHDALIIWVGLGLLALAGQAQRLTRYRDVGSVPVGLGERLVRAVLPLVVLLLAYALTPLTVTVARATRERMFGLMNPRLLQRLDRGHSNTLSLASPPVGVAGHVRPLLAIAAASPPGYLREAVYASYARGQWSRNSVTRELMPSEGTQDAASDADGRLYMIADVGPGRPVAWAVQALAPRRLQGLCLPGDAYAVVLDGDVAPVADADGIVTLAEGPPPARFSVRVARATSAAAFQGPVPTAETAYLALPPHLSATVSNWVAACEGLDEGVPPAVAMQVVERHFRSKYRYRLGVRLKGAEPLESFIREREGHCTLFASAAALMLRARGIPARLVGGFVCTERQPLTGWWTVRERDAHAWCEAWDAEAACWRLVEATPSDGLPGDAPSPGAIRLLAEGMGAAWRGLVEWVRKANPLMVVAEGGLWLWSLIRAGLMTPMGLVVSLGGLVVWVRWQWRRLRGRSVDSVARLRAELVHGMTRLERRFVPAGLRRRGDETWAGWQLRSVPHLPLEVAARLDTLVAEYQDLRYRPQLDVVRARAWLKASRQARERGARVR